MVEGCAGGCGGVREAKWYGVVMEAKGKGKLWGKGNCRVIKGCGEGR